MSLIIRELGRLSERLRYAEVDAARHLVGAPESWKIVGGTLYPFLNGWSSDPDREPVAFRKDPEGFVQLRGALQHPNPTVGTAFILPLRRRPPYAAVNHAIVRRGAGDPLRSEIVVLPTGEVIVALIGGSDYRLVGLDSQHMRVV